MAMEMSCSGLIADMAVNNSSVDSTVQCKTNTDQSITCAQQNTEFTHKDVPQTWSGATLRKEGSNGNAHTFKRLHKPFTLNRNPSKERKGKTKCN